MFLRRLILTGAIMSVFTTKPAHAQVVAQEAVDLSVIEQIREEGLERSQMDPLAMYMTDVIGPRLTGSPGIQRAREWLARPVIEVSRALGSPSCGFCTEIPRRFLSRTISWRPSRRS